MKILVAGDWHSNLHEDAVYRALKKLNHKVFKFSWAHYFLSKSFLGSLFKKIQSKLLFGPIISKLNHDLFLMVQKIKPEIIFIYRGTHINATTLTKIKFFLPSVKIVGYNNDDPFSPNANFFLWRVFKKAISKYDIMLAYRAHNIEQYLKAGAAKSKLFRSWYLPDIHKKIKVSQSDRRNFSSDCIFVGHFENDGRDLCIAELIKNGVHVRVFGPYEGFGDFGWNKPVCKSAELKKILPIYYLDSNSYVKAINSNSIALCFLSKLNRDTYTRRCFEIPAMGAALFSEYSYDLAKLFKDGKEAVFFKNKEELVSKVLYYKSHPQELNKIRENGMRRVREAKHDIDSQMKNFLEMVS